MKLYDDESDSIVISETVQEDSEKGKKDSLKARTVLRWLLLLCVIPCLVGVILAKMWVMWEDTNTDTPNVTQEVAVKEPSGGKESPTGFGDGTLVLDNDGNTLPITTLSMKPEELSPDLGEVRWDMGEARTYLQGLFTDLRINHEVETLEHTSYGWYDFVYSVDYLDFILIYDAYYGNIKGFGSREGFSKEQMNFLVDNYYILIPYIVNDFYVLGFENLYSVGD